MDTVINYLPISSVGYIKLYVQAGHSAGLPYQTTSVGIVGSTRHLLEQALALTPWTGCARAAAARAPRV